MLLSAVCLLAAFLFISAASSPISAQNAQSAPAKPAKPESKPERDDKSEREKRDELSKKLERRREELNAIPVNNIAPSRSVKTQDAAPASTETKKEKEKK